MIFGSKRKKEGIKVYQAGLILEGGGMTGIYSAGVLDFFLDKGIEFSSCYGVSAGACNMCSYLSKQKKRAFDVIVDYLNDKHYCSPYSLLTTGDLFGVDMCYHKIPEELNPYDYETFKKYQGKAYAVVTNIVTGKPEYIRIKDMKADIDAVRASASLPLVSRNVKYNGNYYLDGGISDSIPIKRSILGGNQKNVVIMTKEEGYTRKPSTTLAAVRVRYIKYPQVYQLMKNRHLMYNNTLSYLEEQVGNGNAFVIRPRLKSNVGRIEKDRSRLQALYNAGYRETEAKYDRLMEYLEG